MNNRRLLFVVLITALLLSSVFLSGCGPVKDLLLDTISSRSAGESGPSESGSAVESTTSGAVTGSDLPSGFPQQTPLLPGNIILAQHDASQGEEWYFINYNQVTEKDPDTYIQRLSSAGWQHKDLVEFDGGWIVTAQYRSDFVLQASVFTDDQTGMLVVTTDIGAY